MLSRTINSVRERWFPKGDPGPSVFGGVYSTNPAGDAACYPFGEYGPDLRADLNSSRGALMTIAVGSPPTESPTGSGRTGAEPVSQKLIEHMLKTYSDIPPDIDRLVALRATLDGALGLEETLHPSPIAQDAQGRLRQRDEAKTANSVLVATIADGGLSDSRRLYAVSAGGCRGYHIRANGRIDAIRLEPSAQKELEPGDSVLLCSSGLTAKLDEYDIALSLYSRSPQSAVRHLFDMSARRDAQGPKIAVVYGTQRSLKESVFGRSNGG